MMKKYESPKMKFEELALFEKIADDKCWSAKELYYDVNNNGEPECFEELFLVGCEDKCNSTNTDLILFQIFKLLTNVYSRQSSSCPPPTLDATTSNIPGIIIRPS